jgi:hypothetical protein
MSKIRTTCEHEKRKDSCAICSDCGHGKLKYNCKECGGTAICENKKIVFRTRDANSSINIMKLASCWIEKQERPLCFHISSFTSSSKNNEDEKVRPS